MNIKNIIITCFLLTCTSIKTTIGAEIGWSNLPKECIDEWCLPHLSLKELFVFSCVSVSCKTLAQISMKRHDVPLRVTPERSLNHLQSPHSLLKWCGSLTLKEHINLQEADFTLFSNLPNLNKLELYKCKLEVYHLSFLATLKNVFSLSLGGNELKDPGALIVSQWEHLRELNLWMNGIGDSGATALSFHPYLRTLNLSGNEITNPGAEALSKSKTLVQLDVSFNNISDDGARFFFSNKGMKVNLDSNPLSLEVQAILERM